MDKNTYKIYNNVHIRHTKRFYLKFSILSPFDFLVEDTQVTALSGPKKCRNFNSATESAQYHKQNRKKNSDAGHIKTKGKK